MKTRHYHRCSLPRVKFARIVVVFASSFPNAVVWRAVGTFNVEDELLNEIDLVDGEDDLQVRCDHLG